MTFVNGTTQTDNFVNPNSLIFNNLTSKGQEIMGSIMDEAKNYTKDSEFYNSTSGLLEGLDELERLATEEGMSGITFKSDEEGNITVTIDEGKDGTAERTATYDKNGNKISETVDYNQDGKADAIIYFDEEGKAYNVQVDENSDGKLDYKENYEEIDGQKVNDVSIYEINENGTQDRNDLQYVDVENTYYAWDYGNDGSLESERKKDGYIVGERSHGSRHTEINS